MTDLAAVLRSAADTIDDNAAHDVHRVEADACREAADLIDGPTFLGQVIRAWLATNRKEK